MIASRRFALAALTASLLFGAAAGAKDLGAIYDDATLRAWQARYERGALRNFNTVIRPVLEQAGVGGLDAVQFDLPLRETGQEPFAYYSSGPPPTVTMSVTSLKLFDDLVTAIAWLERNGYSNQAPYDYISMLKYRDAAELGGRYPAPFDAMGIPANALDDERVAYTAGRIFDSAIAFVMLHELGHLVYGHPGYGPGVSRPAARANEAAADRFALEAMARAASDPSGMVFLFLAFVHGLPNRGDVASDAEYEAAISESTHPVTSDRVAAIADWLQTHANDFVTSDGRNTTEASEILYLAEQLAGIARLMADPEWQQATAFAGRQTTLDTLAPRRAGELPAAPAATGDLTSLPAFQGTFDGEIGLPDGTLPIRTVLRRSGTRVNGKYYYGSGEGRLEGLIRNDTLYFQWREGGLTGYGAFEPTGDGMQFAGRWGMRESPDDGGSWSGTRVGQ